MKFIVSYLALTFSARMQTEVGIQMSSSARACIDGHGLSAETLLTELSSLLMLHSADIVDGVKVLLKRNDFLRDRVIQLENEKNLLLRTAAASQLSGVANDITKCSGPHNSVQTKNACFDDVFGLFDCKAAETPTEKPVNSKNFVSGKSVAPFSYYSNNTAPSTTVKTVHVDATATTSHTSSTASATAASKPAQLPIVVDKTLVFPRCYELFNDRWDYSMEYDGTSDDDSVVDIILAPTDGATNITEQYSHSIPTTSTIPVSHCNAGCVIYGESSVSADKVVHEAAECKNDEILRSNTMRDSSGCNAVSYLYDSCSNGSVDCVTNNSASLVFDLTRVNEYAIAAVESSHLRYLQSLLCIGANVNTIDSCGNTLLILAAQYDNLLMCQALINQGADVHRQNAFGLTALSCSCTKELRAYLKAQVASILLCSIVLYLLIFVS